MKIGVIGGSGLYQWNEPLSERIVETPYGFPSSPVFHGTIGSHEIFFLARHGLHHEFSPSEVNYQANVFALKSLGCEKIISVSAVGSLKEELVPGDFVLPDQYLDLTKGKRASTFFEKGTVGHVHFARPSCSALSQSLLRTARSLNLRIHSKGSYVCIEGPQFSTQAESFLYRSMTPPPSVIGMTAVPESKLAREASLCFQTVALVTDYDCWRENEEEVTVESVMKVMAQNVSKARELIRTLLSTQLEPCKDHCNQAGRTSVVTPKQRWSNPQAMEVLLG